MEALSWESQFNKNKHWICRINLVFIHRNNNISWFCRDNNNNNNNNKNSCNNNINNNNNNNNNNSNNQSNSLPKAYLEPSRTSMMNSFGEIRL